MPGWRRYAGTIPADRPRIAGWSVGGLSMQEVMRYHGERAVDGPAAILRRFSRSLFLAAAVFCFLAVIALMCAPMLLRHSPTPRLMESGAVSAWLFVAPGLAGAGVLFSLLAAVLADRKRHHKAASVLLAVLATLFLVLMSKLM